MKKIVLTSVVLMTLVACNQKAHIDQSKICIYSTDEEAKQCVAGELSWFKPTSWGNEQLPINVAGVYCDFNYPITYNKAGFICVFTDKRLSLLSE